MGSEDVRAMGSRAEFVQAADDDTVFVAEGDPLTVQYDTERDTVFVRMGKQAPAVVTASATGSAQQSESGPSETGATTATPTERASTDGAQPTGGVKEGISMSGLVVDETHSVIGRDFYTQFQGHWTRPENVSDYTIRIRERPLPQFGSRLTVRVGQTTIFQGHLRPQYRQIDQAAQQAVARAQYYLTEFYEPREVY